jgi:flagellar assembly factor FliW
MIIANPTLEPMREPASASLLHLETTRFGAIKVDPELVITLPEGLIGFEDCTRFVLLHLEEASPLRWFQSLDDGAVAFPIIDPWFFLPDYTPAISDYDAACLGLTEESPKLMFVILTIPRDNPGAMTANLLGPVLINPVTRRGKQVIVQDEGYTTRHPVLETLARVQRHAA